jgi:hypothetical protein
MGGATGKREEEYSEQTQKIFYNSSAVLEARSSKNE